MGYRKNLVTSYKAVCLYHNKNVRYTSWDIKTLAIEQGMQVK